MPGGCPVFVRFFFRPLFFFEKFSGKIQPGFFEIFLLNVFSAERDEYIDPFRSESHKKFYGIFFLHPVFSGKCTGLVR